MGLMFYPDLFRQFAHVIGSMLDDLYKILIDLLGPIVPGPAGHLFRADDVLVAGLIDQIYVTYNFFLYRESHLP
jgi:hypothetical protein